MRLRRWRRRARTGGVCGRRAGKRNEEEDHRATNASSDQASFLLFCHWTLPQSSRFCLLPNAVASSTASDALGCAIDDDNNKDNLDSSDFGFRHLLRVLFQPSAADGPVEWKEFSEGKFLIRWGARCVSVKERERERDNKRNKSWARSIERVIRLPQVQPRCRHPRQGPSVDHLLVCAQLAQPFSVQCARDAAAGILFGVEVRPVAGHRVFAAAGDRRGLFQVGGSISSSSSSGGGDGDGVFYHCSCDSFSLRCVTLHPAR